MTIRKLAEFIVDSWNLFDERHAGWESSVQSEMIKLSDSREQFYKDYTVKVLINGK